MWFSFDFSSGLKIQLFRLKIRFLPFSISLSCLSKFSCCIICFDEINFCVYIRIFVKFVIFTILTPRHKSEAFFIHIMDIHIVVAFAIKHIPIAVSFAFTLDWMRYSAPIVYVSLMKYVSLSVCRQVNVTESMMNYN